MRRLALVICTLVACGFAGALAGAVPAQDLVGGATTTGTTTTVATTTTTTTSTTTTSTTATTTTTPSQQYLPAGVSIAGVRVGGLTPAQAYAVVRQRFQRPLVVVVGKHRLALAPTTVATAYAQKAVARARSAAPGSAIRLQVAVKRAKVAAYVARVAKRLDRTAVDAQLSLRDLKPWLSKDRAGARLLQKPAVRMIVAALAASRRAPVRLRQQVTPARVTRANFGPVVVIHRGQNRLMLYDGMRLWRTFAVATGQTTYPTPLGRFQIVVMWKNPWWYPPNDPWAVGEKPTPPGPDNPLGTRWMGLSAAGVGIHGTNNDSSIGYSVSHGCIRMHVPDAEWLFNQVRIGTVVYIVAR